MIGNGSFAMVSPQVVGLSSGKTVRSHATAPVARSKARVRHVERTYTRVSSAATSGNIAGWDQSVAPVAASRTSTE